MSRPFRPWVVREFDPDVWSPALDTTGFSLICPKPQLFFLELGFYNSIYQVWHLSLSYPSGTSYEESKMCPSYSSLFYFPSFLLLLKAYRLTAFHLERSSLAGTHISCRHLGEFKMDPSSRHHHHSSRHGGTVLSILQSFTFELFQLL